MPYPRFVPSQGPEIANDLGTLLPELAALPRGAVPRSPLTDAQLGPAVRGEIGLDAVNDPMLRATLRSVQSQDPGRWDRLRGAMSPIDPLVQPVAPPPAAASPGMVSGVAQAPPSQPSKYMQNSPAAREITARNLARKAQSDIPSIAANARRRLENLADNHGDPIAGQYVDALQGVGGNGSQQTPWSMGMAFDAPRGGGSQPILPPLGQRGLPQQQGLAGAGVGASAGVGVGVGVGAAPMIQGPFSGASIPDATQMSQGDWISAVTPEIRHALMAEIKSNPRGRAASQLDRIQSDRSALATDRTFSPRQKQIAEDKTNAEEMDVLYRFVNDGHMQASAILEQRRQQQQQAMVDAELKQEDRKFKMQSDRDSEREQRTEKVRADREQGERTYKEQQQSKVDAAKSTADAATKKEKDAREKAEKAESERSAKKKEFLDLVEVAKKDIVAESLDAKPPADLLEQAIVRAKKMKAEIDSAMGEETPGANAAAPSKSMNPTGLPIRFVNDKPYPLATPEQAESLPSGTVYLDENGKKWRVK